MQINKKRLIGVVVITAVLVALIGTGIVIGQDGGDSNDNIIYLAYHKTNGKLRYINSPDESKPSEEVLILNKQAQQGPMGPQGEPGEQGPQGEPGDCDCEITRAEFEALAKRVTELEGQAGCIDADGDGYGTGPACLGADCDDSDADINPAAEEICDGIDNDCDGDVDEGCLVCCSIAEVRASVGPVDLNLCEVFVTYVAPYSFFIQEDTFGPAIQVYEGPGWTQDVEVGDLISMHITETSEYYGIRQVTGHDPITIHSSGNDISFLDQVIVQPPVPDLESEIVIISNATITAIEGLDLTIDYALETGVTLSVSDTSSLSVGTTFDLRAIIDTEIPSGNWRIHSYHRSDFSNVVTS